MKSLAKKHKNSYINIQISKKFSMLITNTNGIISDITLYKGTVVPQKIVQKYEDAEKLEKIKKMSQKITIAI
jgi:hypothetical protein